MKHTVLFLFFLFNISFINNKTSIESIQNNPSYYYKLSLDEKISKPQKLRLIEKSINLARITDSTVLYLKSLSRKSSIYREYKDYDSAIVNTYILKEKSQVLENDRYNAVASRKLGYYYKKKGLLVDAIKNYQEALLKYKLIRDSLEVGKALKNIADIQNDIGVYNDAEASAIEALSYVEGIKGADLTWIYNALGRSSKELEDYNEALKWYNKALESERSELSKATIKQNIALVYFQQERFTDAINILEPLLKTKSVIEKSSSLARIKSTLAKTKAKIGSLEAENELLEAYEIRKNGIDKKGLYSSCILLSDFYIKTSLSKALKYAEEANSIAKLIKSPDAELESLSYLILFSENADSKKYGIRYALLNDSLIKAKNKQRNLYAGYKYNIEKVEKEKLKLVSDNIQKDLEISKSQTRNLILGFGIISLFLLSVITYYIQKQKAKQKVKLSKLQERYQTETRLSKKVHDEVGNDIFYLMTQIDKDPSLLKEKGLKLLDGLQTIYSKARDISREYTDIDTEEGFSDELLSLLNSFGNNERKIVTRQLTSDFWETVNQHIKKEVFRIVQELLINMKKHSKASFVMIAFTEESQKLKINYSDDGVGIDVTSQKLKSVENRIQELRGILTFDSQSNEGLSVSIELPIK